MGTVAVLDGRSYASQSVSETPFLHTGGYSWQVRLPADLAAKCDDMCHADRSPWRLLEDDKLLGPPHAIHMDIADVGGGRYSHWQDYLCFSTPDNSDPNWNGRHYALAETLL